MTIGHVGLLAWLVALQVAPAQTQTTRVTLKLNTGGTVAGLVVDHTDHGLVVVQGQTPYVFSWGEIEAGAAFRAKHDLLVLDRGGRENLTAADHFQLGVFALSRGRVMAARRQFDLARQLDPGFVDTVQRELDRHRRQNGQSADGRNGQADSDDVPKGEDGSVRTPLAELVAGSFAGGNGTPTHITVSPETRALVRSVYDAFGETVEGAFPGVVRIETEHFLIYTDWDAASRGHLAEWCESMYTALCRVFGLDPSENVFLAKCPIFCWRNKARFLRFARRFDGFDGAGAVGYTRSIQKTGHVHVVLFRRGRSAPDEEAFAWTLVHEGSHAVLHRMHSTRLIPQWVNEGLADLVAERVLGDRCPAGENAALLALQYARYDWSIGALLANAGPIDVHQYPLAHSIIAYLESLGPDRFARFLISLKDGNTAPEALSFHFDGLTTRELEAGWRAEIRATARNVPP